MDLEWVKVLMWPRVLREAPAAGFEGFGDLEPSRSCFFGRLRRFDWGWPVLTDRVGGDRAKAVRCEYFLELFGRDVSSGHAAGYPTRGPKCIIHVAHRIT